MNIEQKKVYDTLYEKIVNSAKGLSELGYQIGSIEYRKVKVCDMNGDNIFDVRPYGMSTYRYYDISSEGTECVRQIQLALREMKSYLDNLGRIRYEI